MGLLGFTLTYTGKLLFVFYFVTLILSLFSPSFCENRRGYDVSLRFNITKYSKSGQEIPGRNMELHGRSTKIYRSVRNALNFLRNKNTLETAPDNTDKSLKECGHCDCKMYPMLTAICVLSSLAFLASIRSCFTKFYYWLLNCNVHSISQQQCSEMFQPYCLGGNSDENIQEGPPGLSGHSSQENDGMRTVQMTNQDETAGGISFADVDGVGRSPADHQRHRSPLLPPRKILQAMPGFLSRKTTAAKS